MSFKPSPNRRTLEFCTVPGIEQGEFIEFISSLGEWEMI